MFHALALTAPLAFAPLAEDKDSVLPEGTYRYGVYDSGERRGTSTIVVTRHDGTLQIAETVTFKDGDEPLKTLRTLDPKTFTTLEYAVAVPGERESAVIAAHSATYHQGAKTTQLDAAIEGPSIVGDYMVGGYIALPALVHATSVRSINAYCDCFTGFQVEAATVVDATETRPAGVPAQDEAIGFRTGDATATLWYDPQTFVLRELDVPSSRIKIALDWRRR